VESSIVIGDAFEVFQQWEFPCLEGVEVVREGINVGSGRDGIVGSRSGSGEFGGIKTVCLRCHGHRYEARNGGYIGECGEVIDIEASMPEGAGDPFVEAIANNSESIAVVRDTGGVPQALGAMSFSNPWSKWDVQREIGPCFGGLKYFGSEVCKFSQTVALVEAIRWRS
jgi:hypothetical protein